MNPQASATRDPRNRPAIAPVMRLAPINAAANEYELLVYGDIGESWWGESVTASSVVQQLNDLPDTVATINVRINSYGGSVSDGLAIYNALKRHPASKAVTVDGVAMSSASLIAMAGDTVTMPPTSLLMIHAPWGGLYGNAKEMRQYADALDKFSASMADAYVVKSGQERDAVLALLTDGEDHYYTGEEAIAAGFADAVGNEDDADTEPTENARGFAAALMERIAGRCSARYMGLAMAAALRGHAPATSSAAAPSPMPPPSAAVTAAPLNPPVNPTATPPAAAGSIPTEATTMTEEEKKAAAKAAADAALAADRSRREAIRNQFSPFATRDGLDQTALAALRQECEDNTDTTVEQASAKLLAFLGQNTTPTAGQRIEGGREIGVEAYREGAALAVLGRTFGHAVSDERAQQFRGFNAVDLARDCVERAGIRTRGMSRNEIAVKALHSTSDFPSILDATVTRTLRQGYELAGRTFQPFCRRATLPDFKEISRVQLGGAPSLKRVLEGEEYEYGSIGQGAEKYRVHKYGRLFSVTWETLINDDLGAILTQMQGWGASAGEMESDIVYAILTGNPAMADGKTLFHADHRNTGTAAALIDQINPASDAPKPVTEMRKKFRLQKGLDDRYITVTPSFLIVPAALEQDGIDVTTRANTQRPQDQNKVIPSLQVIAEGRLDDASEQTWYGAASPTTVDTIEYAFLEGHEGVFTESRNGFEVDGMQFKARHVFGAKAIDWRGLYRNAGAARTPWPGQDA